MQRYLRPCDGTRAMQHENANRVKADIDGFRQGAEALSRTAFHASHRIGIPIETTKTNYSLTVFISDQHNISDEECGRRSAQFEAQYACLQVARNQVENGSGCY